MASNEKARTFFGEKRNPVATASGSDSLRLCVSAVIISLTALFAQAQLRGGQGWVWQNPLPQGNPLFSVHFAKDKENGFAVGSDNAILRTKDGGFSWERQTAPGRSTRDGLQGRRPTLQHPIRKPDLSRARAPLSPRCSGFPHRRKCRRRA